MLSCNVTSLTIKKSLEWKLDIRARLLFIIWKSEIIILTQQLFNGSVGTSGFMAEPNVPLMVSYFATCVLYIVALYVTPWPLSL